MIADKLKQCVTPDLIQKKYRTSHPLSGSCYIVSEALYHLWGKENGYNPARIKTELGWHWFLVKDNEVLDPTAEQFPYTLDYSTRKNSAFLTTFPSKRARTLIERAMNVVA